jgi:hypothetical protein
MENGKSRREWIRKAAMGAAGAGIGAMAGCGSGTDKAQEKSPEKTKEQLLALNAGQPLQVICHGMMAFKLPKPGASPYIEIHIPIVLDGDYTHAYMAGDRAGPVTYNMSNLSQGAEYKLTVNKYTVPPTLPSSFYRTPNLLLFSQDARCKCSMPDKNDYRYCRITLPMPDDYQGYVLGSNNDSSALFAGADTVYCTNPFQKTPPYPYPLASLTTVPLVHVFRYHTFESATFDQTAPSSKPNLWGTAQNGYKFFIYAEPSKPMPASNQHLLKLDALMGLKGADLDFRDSSKLAPASDPGDSQINDQDLLPLSSFWMPDTTSKAAPKAGPTKGGNPADCISGWGS